MRWRARGITLPAATCAPSRLSPVKTNLPALFKIGVNTVEQLAARTSAPQGNRLLQCRRRNKGPRRLRPVTHLGDPYYPGGWLNPVLPQANLEGCWRVLRFGRAERLWWSRCLKRGEIRRNCSDTRAATCRRILPLGSRGIERC